MKKLILFALMCFAVLFATEAISQPAYVTAYYPTWSECTMSPSDIDFSVVTHIILFSADIDTSKSPYFAPVTKPSDSSSIEFGVPNPNCSPQGKWGKPAGYSYIQWFIDVAHPKNAKVLLCIGGIWGSGATKMKWVISDQTRRTAYIQSIVAYCKRKGFDGVDVDLEHPNGSTRDYMNFMKELRAEFDRVYTTHATITIAAGAWTDNNAYKPYSELFTYIDQCNLMSYDFSGGSQAWFNAGLGNNTVLYPYTGPSKSSSSWWNWQNHGVDQWIALGAPANKLSMGIPFYSWRFSGPTKIGDPINGRWYGTYPEAITKRANSALNPVYTFDDSAKAPFLTYTENGVNYFITYDDTNSIPYKVDFIKKRQTGIMIYELWSGWVNNAPSGMKDPLLQSVKKAIGGIIIVPPDTIKDTVIVPPPPPPTTPSIWLTIGDTTVFVGDTVTIVGNSNSTTTWFDLYIDNVFFNNNTSRQTATPASFKWIATRGTHTAYAYALIGSTWYKSSTRTIIVDTVYVPPPPVVATATLSVSSTSVRAGRSINIYGNGTNLSLFDIYLNGVFYKRMTTIPFTEVWYVPLGTTVISGIAQGNSASGGKWINTNSISVTGTRTRKTNALPIATGAYPNPFNPTTTIEVNLDSPTYVTTKIYNVYGQEVAVLFDEHLSDGPHYATFNASNLPSGIYFCNTIAGDKYFHIKLMLLK